MSDLEIYDPYPDETRSMNDLSDECPIKYLTYGILTEKISDLVAEQRRKIQKNKREFLIMKLNNTLLKERQRSFVPRSISLGFTQEEINNWKHLGSNKSQILRWFTRNEIPIIYLEELYQMQIKGPETLVKNDYIIINKYNEEYGRVSEVKGKTVYYNTVHVHREWDKDLRKYINDIQWTTPIHMHPIYIARVCQRRYETMLQLGKSIDREIETFLLPEDLLFKESPYTRHKCDDTKCVSIWKCEKIGHNPNWEVEFMINKERILTEIHLRQAIWLKSMCLRYVDMKAFGDYYNLNFDIINKEKPPKRRWVVGVCISHGVALDYDDVWGCIEDAIDIYLGNSIDDVNNED